MILLAKADRSAILKICLFAVSRMNGVCAEIPNFFLKESKPDPVEFARTANHFISLGEDGARKALMNLVRQCWMEGVDADEKISWICRAIYISKSDEPIPMPGFGGLNLPYDSMPLEHWPMLPVVLSEGVLFVAAEGYDLYGKAQSIGEYVLECSNRDNLRKVLFTIPSKDQAEMALETLFRSPRWNSVNWKESLMPEGESYCRDFLSAQVRRVPTD